MTPGLSLLSWTEQLPARWTSVGRGEDCRESSTAGKGRLPQKLQQPRCYQCGVTGHLARDCCKFQKPLSGNVRCYNCGAMGHLAKNCRARKTESSGTQQKNWGNTRQVQTADSTLPGKQSQETAEKPEDFLLSSGSNSDTSDVRQVRIQDRGSQPRCAKVEVQGGSCSKTTQEGLQKVRQIPTQL